MKKLYVDSCIFISYLTNEMNTSNNYKGDRYHTFFELFYTHKFKLVISTWVINEVKRYFKYKNQDFLDSMFENLIQEFKNCGNLIILRFDEEDKEKARELDSSNYPDALHVILALKYNCSILTTENIVDFRKYKDIIEVLHPLDLI